MAMVIFGLLATTAVWSLRAYQRAQDESGTAHGVVTSLRNVAERAQSEGRTYCVSFDSATSWSVWRYSCQSGWSSGSGSAVQVLGNLRVQGSSSVAGISFAASANGDACPAGGGRCAYFYPRGTASAGQLSVTRSGSSTTYIVKVEGLTGRVYLG